LVARQLIKIRNSCLLEIGSEQPGRVEFFFFKVKSTEDS
jgi:hypothetical protein